MAGPPWTSEENITTLLLVPYVKRDKLTEILKALHENEERRYCFNERTAEAVNSHVGRMIKDLRIDRSNSNLSPAAIACRIAQEWDKKGEDPFLTDFIDSILYVSVLSFKNPG